MCFTAQADDIYTFVVKKQEAKKKTRWSLAEWLETRDRVMLMDLWLAFNSPSPYEFYLGGTYQLSQKDDFVAPKKDYLGIDLAAFAHIFGFRMEYLARRSRIVAAFNVRIFGFHDQSTNITLEAGIKSEMRGFRYRNAFLGIRTSIYLFKNSGIEGLYRNYYDSVPAQNGQVISGKRYEGTLFVDFSFFRVFGTYFSEPETLISGGVTSEGNRIGVTLGSRIYF